MTFRLAVAQSLVGLDPHANAAAVRDLMRQARAAGADLAHFPEGAVSGYPSGPGKPHFKGWSGDWEGLRRELESAGAPRARRGGGPPPAPGRANGVDGGPAL